MDDPQLKPEVPTSWGQDQRKWHIDKTISVGHIASTVMLAAAAFAWAGDVDKRIDQNLQAIQYLTAEQKEEKRRLEALRSELRDDLATINQKLDRLIEHQAGM